MNRAFLLVLVLSIFMVGSHSASAQLQCQSVIQSVDPAQIEAAVDKNCKLTPKQFDLIKNDEKKKAYVSGEHFDPTNEKEQEILRAVVRESEQLTLLLRQNARRYLEIASFAFDETKSFFHEIASSHIQVINDNPEIFKKYASAVQGVKFETFEASVSFDKDKQVFFTVGDKANQINFEDLKGYAAQGLKIRVGIDGEIVLSSSLAKEERILRLSGITYKTQKHDGGLETFSDDFASGRIVYATDKPAFEVPQCDDCKIMIGPNADLQLEGKNVLLFEGVRLQAAVFELPLSGEMRDFLMKNKDLSGYGVSYRIEGDTVIFTSQLAKAVLSQNGLSISPFSSIATKDGVFTVSGIITGKYRTYEIDSRSVSVFFDNKLHADETGSYIQVVDGMKTASIAARFNQHIMVDLATDEFGVKKHDFNLIDANTIGGRITIREGRSVTISEYGGLKSMYLPQTQILTNTGYFASTAGIGKCANTCLEVIKMTGLYTQETLEMNRRMNEWYMMVKDTTRDFPTQDIHFPTATEFLVSLYSRDQSEKVLKAIASFGEESLLTLNGIATQLSKQNSDQTEKAIALIRAMGSEKSDELIAAYLKDDKLALPTAIVLAESKDERALSFFKTVIEARYSAGALDIERLAMGVLKYKTAESKALMSAALESKQIKAYSQELEQLENTPENEARIKELKASIERHLEVKYATAMALAKDKDDRAIPVLAEIMHDMERTKWYREQAVESWTKFNLASGREYLEEVFKAQEPEAQKMIALSLIPKDISTKEPNVKPDDFITKSYFASLDEDTRNSIMQIWKQVISNPEFDYHEREKGYQIAKVLAYSDDSNAQALIHASLNDLDGHTRYFMAVGISGAERQSQYPELYGILKDMALDPTISKSERLEAVRLILIGGGNDPIRSLFSEIYAKTPEDDMRREIISSVARRGDYSVMGDLLRFIKNPEFADVVRSAIDPAFEYAEKNPTSLFDKKAPFLKGLQLLYDNDPQAARKALSQLEYQDDFVSSLRKMDEAGYAFDRREYLVLAAFSQDKALEEKFLQRVKYLDGEKIDLNDAAILLWAPENLLKLSKRELQLQLEKVFDGKEVMTAASMDGDNYCSRWNCFRDRATKKDLLTAVAVESAWRKGDFDIVYDNANWDHPELRGKKLSAQEFINLDIKEDKTELAGLLELSSEGKLIFRIYDPKLKVKNEAHHRQDPLPFDAGVVNIGIWHSHATSALEDLYSGPSCGAGAGDCHVAYAEKKREFVLTPTSKGLNLDSVNNYVFLDYGLVPLKTPLSAQRTFPRVITGR